MGPLGRIEMDATDSEASLHTSLVSPSGNRSTVASTYLSKPVECPTIRFVCTVADGVLIRREQIRCLNTKDAPVILVTNKMDLLYDGVVQKRAVNQEEVIEYANSYNCRWIEVTAKEFISVENIFQTVFAQKLLSNQEYKSLKKRRQSMPLPQPPQSRASGKTGRSASASEVSRSKSSSCILS